jgi:hypothetical protein
MAGAIEARQLPHVHMHGAPLADSNPVCCRFKTNDRNLMHQVDST